MKVFKGLIYKAKRGHICDESRKRIHPGYNVSPVPIDVDALGEIIQSTVEGQEI